MVKMPYEPVEVDARMLRKDKAFLTFFSGDEEAFRDECKKALETMKRNSGRIPGRVSK